MSFDVETAPAIEGLNETHKAAALDPATLDAAWMALACQQAQVEDATPQKNNYQITSTVELPND